MSTTIERPAKAPRKPSPPGKRNGPLPTPAAERFWPKVDKNGPIPEVRPDLGPCWVWRGGRYQGYGTFHPTASTIIRAYRWAYTTLVGPVPPGLELDHLCRNRACVNPTHLEVVPHRINVLRGTAPMALNARKTHCTNGHEFTPENTWTSKDDCRRCRICHSETRRRYLRRRKGETQ
jgi:hypothetical protein